MTQLLWRPLEEENIRDPYGMYATLRRHDPIHRAQTGEFIISRYEHIKEILKNPTFETGNRLTWLQKGIRYFDNKQEDFRAIYKAVNSFVLMLNHEQHLRMRNFISASWNDRHVDGLIAKNISAVLKKVRGSKLDFVKDYAQRVPLLTIAGILGIPTVDYEHLVHLGVGMTKTLDLYVSMKDLVSMNHAASDFIDFFQEQIKQKTDRPDNSLLGKLIDRNREEKCGLTEEELISIAIFLFTAGEETSAGLISNAMFTLLQHPEQMALMRRDPALTESAIEEVLRYDSVVQLLGRTAKEETVVGGIIFPAGSTATLVIGSGNRDEDMFDRADEFIISRKPNRHLSFGSGVHYCLGDWLGRKQSQMTLEAFLDRYPEISLLQKEFSWYKNLAVRRLDALEVQLSTRKSV